MLKRNKILLIVLAILISLVAFLSFGFQTSNFNDLIQKRFNDQYKKVKLEFKDIRVSLDIKDFAVKFSLNQPKLYHKGDLTNIYQTNFGVGIFSAIKGNYNPKFIEIKFSENSFEKSINLIRDVFLEDNQKSYFDNKVKKGFIKGDLKIYNEDTVKIEFLGSIKDTSFIISNELPEFQNINADIEYKNNELNINISSGSAAGLNFDKSKISLFKSTFCSLFLFASEDNTIVTSPLRIIDLTLSRILSSVPFIIFSCIFVISLATNICLSPRNSIISFIIETKSLAGKNIIIELSRLENFS